ncbi:MULTISPECIES: alpha/beta hydrolase [Bacillaceae]|uniref:alpha/beta hydrolase n=1 Tax=Bacillaceae TaxID=186817 RepID=UPI000E72D975|nr:alpha/beta hydrolase [Bacillus sp. PK3_68]RJS60076.1 phospholipase [Bacillus sp. PK3_68]
MWKWETEQQPKGVIVMIHGAMEHHGRYGWLIEMWRRNGFHVVMGDLPGQGMTSRAKRGHISSFNEYIEEVKDWVQAAYQFDLPLFILGHSMGGLIAIRLLQEMEVETAGVILSSPCLGMNHTPPKVMDILSHGLNSLSPSVKFSSGLTVEMATRNEEVRQADKEDLLYVNKVSVRWYRELLQAIKTADLKTGAVPDVPLLVMQAGDDLIVDKKSVRKWFHRLDLSEMHYKEWPGLYHEIFNEPEREEVFHYAKGFVENRLRLLGYVIEE